MTHTAAIIRFPADDAIFARLTERQRLANLAAERAEAVETARYIIDHPYGYSDDQLRAACGFYMTHGNGGVHYLRAEILSWGAFVAVALLWATGWLA